MQEATSGDGPRVSSRAALMAAALEEFTARGYEAATVADIARRAGVTTGALYAHFDSKIELLIEALELRSVGSTLRAAATAATTRPWDEVAALLGQDMARPPSERTQLLLDAIVVARRDPAVATTLRAGLDQHLGRLTRAADAARALGIVDPAVESEQLAKLMAAIAFGLLVLAALDETPPTEETFVRLTDALLQAAGPPPEGDESAVLARVRARAAGADRARADLERTIVTAARAGHSLRAVGEAAGLSHERVRRILAERQQG